MASINFGQPISYWYRTNSSWLSESFGSCHPYIVRPSATDGRAIIPIVVTPTAGHTVTAFQVTLGLTGDDGKPGQLHASLHDVSDISSIQVTTGPPTTGRVAIAAETATTAPGVSGRMSTLKFTGLSITKATTLYMWFYITPDQRGAGYFELWTKAGSSGSGVTNPSCQIDAETEWTYSVAYDANGGTGAPQNQTKRYTQNLTLSSTRPTKANTAATGYKVTFNPNGGTCATADLTAARTTSYTFTSWNTAANGTGTTYNAGATYSANASVTLYAKYSSSTATSAITLPTATRTGYTFLGWSTSSSATSGSTGSYTPTGATTLYAVWKPGGTIRIWNGTKWVLALPFIYTGIEKGWVQAIPYVYKNNTDKWKLCGG